MRSFRCKECGTGYSTAADRVPPSPRWADGHICEMVEVDFKLKITKLQPCQAHADFSEEEEDKLEDRMKIIGQNGNTGEHYEE